MNKLGFPVNPNLPIAPNAYSQPHFDIFSNVLRVYFNRVDSVIQSLLGLEGGRYLQKPHIAASDSTDQYAAGDNTPTIVAWNTLETGSGFTLNAGNTATAGFDGVYKIDFSLQFVNTDNLAHDVAVWLRVDGIDLPRSSSIFSVPARKSAGVYSYIVAYSSITFELIAGQTIGLWWATGKAYNTVGPVDGVYMEAIAAQTVPYARPANPSAVGSIVFVSNTHA